MVTHLILLVYNHKSETTAVPKFAPVTSFDNFGTKADYLDDWNLGTISPTTGFAAWDVSTTKNEVIYDIFSDFTISPKNIDGTIESFLDHVTEVLGWSGLGTTASPQNGS